MKKKTCLVFMNIVYYVAFAVLILMLILPHTTVYYRWNFLSSFVNKVNTKTVYLVTGERYQIKLFEVNKRVTYHSSDIKVADVNISGQILAYRAGKTIVTIKGDKIEGNYRVYVLKLNKKKLKLKVSGVRKLSVKGKLTGVRWKSSNPSVATVNRFGWVKGKKKGTTWITAKVKGKKLKCKVYVK